jgi:[NiFe] hydrogenase small subunit
VVEGAVPTADNGIYGMVAGRTMLDIAQEIVPQAKYTIALGTCAAFGGLPAAAPNPTGAMGVSAAVGVDTINITGCPPHPLNLVACITSYLLNDQIPPLRADGRPTFCHGERIHAGCTYPHGCLRGYNCKGPNTYNNCHRQPFNQESWCVKVEHQCIGCSEPGFWDVNAPFYNPMWAAMLWAYRRDAAAHEFQATTSCTSCHSSAFLDDKRKDWWDDSRRFQYEIHDEHDINTQTNRSCVKCHTEVIGSTDDPIDD